MTNVQELSAWQFVCLYGRSISKQNNFPCIDLGEETLQIYYANLVQVYHSCKGTC